MKHNKMVKFRTNGLFISGGVLFLLGIIAWLLTQPSHPPEYFSFALLSIWFLFAFIGSIFVIKYKEAPGIGTQLGFKGSFATILGILGIIIWGLGFTLSTYKALISFLGK